MQLLSAQIRDYDLCFEEFLKPWGNGQKITQAILLREAFRRFAQQGVGIRQDAPTAILDVSCGPGDYSVTWTSDIARHLPRGMIFYCTDYPGGISQETGEKYTMMTARKIQMAAQHGRLLLAKPAVAIDADLFSGADALMPPGSLAHIIHWSHSGYHVRDALGPDRDDPSAIERGLNIALDKMWAALDQNGLMFSVHQTCDASDGIPSQMLPTSRKYCGTLDDVPERIETRIRQLSGWVATVNFASPPVADAISRSPCAVDATFSNWMIEYLRICALLKQYILTFSIGSCGVGRIHDYACFPISAAISSRYLGIPSCNCRAMSASFVATASDLHSI